jgi:ankyrin repeat protein
MKFGRAKLFGSSSNTEVFREGREVRHFSDLEVPQNLKRYVDLENSLSDLKEEDLDKVEKMIVTNFTEKEMNFVYRKIIFFSGIRPKNSELLAQLYSILLINHNDYKPSLQSICSLSPDFALKLYKYGAVDPIAEYKENNETISDGLFIGKSSRLSDRRGNTIKSVFREVFQNDSTKKPSEKVFSLSLKEPSTRTILYDAVKTDNIDVFREKTSAPEFNWDIVQMTENRNKSIVQASAHYGSINCFKYMVINQVSLENVARHAIRGGNEEIIRICEQNGVKFNRCISAALSGYHINIADYLIKNSYQLDNFDVMDCCNNFQTMIPFLYLQKNGCITDNDLTTAVRSNVDSYVNAILESGKSSFSGRRIVATAAENDNYDLVEKLVDKGFNIDENHNGLTALGYAVNNNNYKLTKLLVDKNADIALNNCSSYIKSGNMEIIKLLIEKGLKITEYDSDGTPVLFSAASTKDLDIFKLIYEKIPNPNIKDRRGTPIAAYAANVNAPEILYFLIVQKADLSELKYVSRHRIDSISNFDVIKLIYENGGDLDYDFIPRIYYNFISDDNLEAVKYLHSKGKTLPSNALRRAVNNNGSNELISFLFENCQDADLADLISIAISNSDLEKVKKIVERGFDVNQTIEHGSKFRYPLGIAIKSGSIPIINYLIEIGAKVEGERDPKKTTVMQSSAGLRLFGRAEPRKAPGGVEQPPVVQASKAKFEIFKILAEKCTNLKELMPAFASGIAKGKVCNSNIDYLIEKGFDPNMFFNEHKLIYYAIRNGNLDLVKKLVSKGANVNESLREIGEPKCALTFAIGKGQIEIAHLLLEKGADINGITNSGKRTPLGKAIKRQNTEFINILLEKGADVNIRYKRDKRTAVIDAVCYGRDQTVTILEQLISKGADINIQTESGRTALFFAKDDNTVEFLINHGLNPNHADEKGRTPLIVMVKNPEPVSLITFLINKGADPNIRSNPQTPFDLMPLMVRDEIKAYYESKKQ